MALEPGTPVREIPLDRVFIGSCTNSRIGDLRDAASMIEGRRVADSIRAMVIGLTVTAIAGTILSQLLLWPGAFLISHVASFFVHGFGGHH